MPMLKLFIKIKPDSSLEDLERIRKILEKNRISFEKINRLTKRFKQFYIFNYKEPLEEHGFLIEIIAPKLNSKKTIKSFYKEDKVFKGYEINETL